MLLMVAGQIGKRSGHYSFDVSEVDVTGDIPMLPASFLNGVRRDLAAALDKLPVQAVPLRVGTADPVISAPTELSYKANIANSEDRAVYLARGAQQMEDAYELSHRAGAELMRSRYCVRHELGLCPRLRKGVRPEPLFLLNSGKRLRLDFHCDQCEMTVSEG